MMKVIIVPHNVTLSINKTASVGDLKQLISKKLNINKESIILKINFVELNDQDIDQKLLSECKIGNGTQIEVATKQFGGFKFDRSQLKPGLKDIGEFDSQHLSSKGRDILMK